MVFYAYNALKKYIFYLIFVTLLFYNYDVGLQQNNFCSMADPEEIEIV